MTSSQLKGGGKWGQKCLNLLSKKPTKGEGGGAIKSEKWTDVVYGWPLSTLKYMPRLSGKNPQGNFWTKIQQN